MIAPANMITILIADNQPLARAGIRVLLEGANDMRIVGEAVNGFEVQRLAARLRPQILLCDLNMPGPSAIQLAGWLRENYPKTITLVLTGHDCDAHLVNMMDAGVAAYMSKNAKAEQIISAIRRAAHGEILFERVQLIRARLWRKEVGDKLNKLTQRELEILKLMTMGLANKTIASTLHISVKTISYHMTNLFSKLQVETRQEAVIWGLKNLSDDLE